MPRLRRAMLAPDRHPLAGLVEVDESSLPLRTKDDPPAGGQGRSHDGKMLIVGAIEVDTASPAGCAWQPWTTHCRQPACLHQAGDRPGQHRQDR